MKLSTRGRYGVRLMVDLAMHYGEGPIFLRNIAERQGISEKYLWNLIHPLKNMGLIVSFRGAQGGYLLARPPAEITLKEILNVLEGSMCFVDCVENPSVCDRSDSCISRDIWSEAASHLLKTLESTTLLTMVERQKLKTGQSADS